MIRSGDSFHGMGEPREFVDVTLGELPNPFASLDSEKREEAGRYIGREADKDYQRLMKRLEQLILQSNPLQALAHFEFYDCTLFDNPDQSKPDGEYVEIQQYGIELLQAMFLTIPVSKLRVHITPSKILLELNSTIRGIGECYGLRGLARELPSDPKLREVERISQQVRMHTFAVRNAGFQDQVMHQLRGVFGRLDQAYRQRTGVTFSALITMWEQLVSLVESKTKTHFDQVTQAYRGNTVEDVVMRYCEARGLDTAFRNQMLDTLRKHKANVDQARAHCTEHSNLSLLDLYRFDISEFVAAYPEPIDASILKPVLERWSYEPQGLVGFDRDHILLDNPIWRRPMIYGGGSWFYWPIIQIFHSFGLEMLETLLSEFPDLEEPYRKSRSGFLEKEVAAEIRKTLPTSTIHTGVEWLDPESGRLYETDIIALLDSVVFVVECKSGRITESARRGSSERLRKEIKKLIEEASVQSARLIQFLKNQHGPVRLKTKTGQEFVVNPDRHRRFARLNVMLDFFGPLACEVRGMQMAGLLNPASVGAPTMSLVDLQTVGDLLDMPAIFLHYMLRRGEIDRRIKTFADEMDLLSLYLGTGFNLGDLEFKDDYTFSFYGLSKQLEPFLYARSAGIAVTKPRLKLTTYWQQVLARFDSARFPNWLLASFAMLTVSHEDQGRFEEAIQETRERIEGKSFDPGELNTVVSTNGPPQRRNSIVAVIVRDVPRKEQLRLINNAVDKAINVAETEEVLFFCHSVVRPDLLYIATGMYLPKN